jgi:GntR family transcriptional regulator
MDTESQEQALFDGLRRPDRSGLPKYQRLAQALVEGIKLGVWRPGERLPAEDALATRTPFSLGTVQRALRDLADQGLVERRHGLGSFVADQPRRIQDPWHCRFLDDDGDTVLPIFSQAIGKVEVKGDGPWRVVLARAARVMRLDRVITVNDEFRVFSRFYADREMLEPLWKMPMQDLHGANFRQLIVSQCRLPITDITRQVCVLHFDDEVCGHIQVPHDTQGLQLQALARAGRDAGVYYQEFFIPPTRRPLQVPEYRPEDH